MTTNITPRTKRIIIASWLGFCLAIMLTGLGLMLHLKEVIWPIGLLVGGAALGWVGSGLLFYILYDEESPQ